MYLFKAKITKVKTSSTFEVNIPALDLKQVNTHALENFSAYKVNDLVMVSPLNGYEWLILGHIQQNSSRGISIFMEELIDVIEKRNIFHFGGISLDIFKSLDNRLGGIQNELNQIEELKSTVQRLEERLEQLENKD